MTSQGLKQMGGGAIMRRVDPADKKLRYQDAGVDIRRGNLLVQRLQDIVKATYRPGVLGGLGGFGALFDMAPLNYRQPVLVAGTDGAGTKLKLAIESGRHDSIGIDLVAMCVNDVIAQGARPLFFLDYFACARLDVETAETVIRGIAAGCAEAACSLIGGETAEMPGLYQSGDYDLAGFCVGVVEKEAIITGERAEERDVLIALPSSGCHANGYALIRKIIADTRQDLSRPLAGRSLLDRLIEPTRIYVKPILALLAQGPVKAIAHITGGGLIENIPRVIPRHLSARIDLQSWRMPVIFRWLQETGNVDRHEMLKTFNCGAGLVLCVEKSRLDMALSGLADAGERPWVIGEITRRDEGGPGLVY